MKKLFVLLVCISLVAMTGTAFADGTKLIVGGAGTVLIESDLAVISVGVREIATDVLDAQSTVNTKIAAVKEALINAGAKESEINTDAINIYANYDYSGTSEAISGYTAYNSLSVRTADIESVGKLIDAAFAAGANALDNVQFTVKDDSIAEEKALQMAVSDAMRKAEILAKAAGMSIESIESIAETETYNYDSMRNSQLMNIEEAGGSAGTMVQAALVSVSTTISVEFELK